MKSGLIISVHNAFLYLKPTCLIYTLIYTGKHYRFIDGINIAWDTPLQNSHITTRKSALVYLGNHYVDRYLGMVLYSTA